MNIQSKKKGQLQIIARLAAMDAVAAERKRNDNCGRGFHIYDRESIMFKGQRACRCGAVEGELES